MFFNNKILQDWREFVSVELLPSSGARRTVFVLCFLFVCLVLFRVYIIILSLSPFPPPLLFEFTKKKINS